MQICYATRQQSARRHKTRRCKSKNDSCAQCAARSKLHNASKRVKESESPIVRVRLSVSVFDCPCRVSADAFAETAWTWTLDTIMQTIAALRNSALLQATPFMGVSWFFFTLLFILFSSLFLINHADSRCLSLTNTRTISHTRAHVILQETTDLSGSPDDLAKLDQTM